MKFFYIETRRKEGIGMDISFFSLSLSPWTRKSYLTHMFDTMFNASREKRNTCRMEEILRAMLEHKDDTRLCLKCASCSMYFAQRFQIRRIISNENYYSIHFLGNRDWKYNDDDLNSRRVRTIKHETWNKDENWSWMQRITYQPNNLFTTRCK